MSWRLVPPLALVAATSDATQDRQGAGCNATQVRRRLGYGNFDDIVAQRCGWESGISALGSSSVYTLMNSNGGYDYMCRGGWGLVVRLKDEARDMQVESILDLALTHHIAAKLKGS